MARNNNDPIELAAQRANAIASAIEQTLQWQSSRCRDAKEMRERLNMYWTKCQNNGEMPSFEAICVALGIPVEEGKRWCKADGCDKEMAEQMQNALAVLEAIDSDLVTRGLIPQAHYMWRSKQYYSMREPSIIHDISGLNPLKDLPTMSDIQKRYLGDLPELPHNEAQLPEEPAEPAVKRKRGRPRKDGR